MSLASPSSGAISIGRIVCVASVSTSAPTSVLHFFLYPKQPVVRVGNVLKPHCRRTGRGLRNQVQTDVILLLPRDLLEGGRETGIGGESPFMNPPEGRVIARVSCGL